METEEACRALLAAGHFAQAVELLRTIGRPPEEIARLLTEERSGSLEAADVLRVCAPGAGAAARALRLFAADCVERAIPSYERYSPPERLEQAVAVARRYARGDATEEEREAACEAVQEAVNDVWSEIPGGYLLFDPEDDGRAPWREHALDDSAAHAAGMAAAEAASPDEALLCGGANPWDSAVDAMGEGERAWQRQRLALYCAALLAGGETPGVTSG